ncbi:MAG: DUF2058 domain-containing protein [Nevskiales bacterium]
MSMSLRDQLLQAGLISKKQAEQAEKQPHHQRKDRSQKKPPTPAEIQRRNAQLAVQKAQAEKLAQDQARSRQQQEKADRKARHAQIKQLVEQNRLPKVEGDDCFNFVDGVKIRRLPVTPETRLKLGNGQLRIVRCEGRYEVVPSAIAERIAERDERAVIPRAVAEETKPDENDPYKDFVVPDDLIW